VKILTDLNKQIKEEVDINVAVQLSEGASRRKPFKGHRHRPFGVEPYKKIRKDINKQTTHGESNDKKAGTFKQDGKGKGDYGSTERNCKITFGKDPYV